MENKYIILLQDTISNDLKGIIGGKAENLIKLARQGLNVPFFFCVSSFAFSEWINQIDIGHILRNFHQADINEHKQLSRELLNQINNYTFFPERLTRKLLEVFDRFFGKDDYVSVRSSALGEDSEDDSHAGILESYLYVSRENLLDFVLACFRSNFSSRAIRYRLERTLPLDSIKGAVIVQKMVNSACSGVMFASNPVNCDNFEIVITAGYGLGEGIVAELVEADTYFVDKETKQIREQIIKSKTRQVNFCVEQKKTKVVSVEKSIRDKPVLNKEKLEALVHAAWRIEELYGHPQDIEWAFDSNDNLFILQSRPITTIPKGNYYIFDNHNICENYPATALPLTFSFTRIGYENAMRNSARRLGATKSVVKNNNNIFKYFTGFIDGHLYYNATHFYRFFSLIPGMYRFLPIWEKTLGFNRNNRLRKEVRYRFRGPVYWGGQLKALTHIMYHFFTLQKGHQKYVQRVQKAIRRVNDNYPLSDLSTQKLYAIYEQFLDETLRDIETTILNDFFAFIYFHFIDQCIQKNKLNDRENLKNDLLSNDGALESAKPIVSILAITRFIREDEKLSSLFDTAKTHADLWKEIQSNSRYQQLYQRIRQHLEQYGDRSTGELKLEIPSTGEQPDLLVGLIQNYLNVDKEDAVLFDRRKRRAEAERFVKNRLRHRPIQLKVFNWLIKLSRRSIAQRENLRFCRARFFGVVRNLFLEIGKRLQADKSINHFNDVFYLTVEEVGDFLYGNSITHDLKGLIASRKNEFEKFEERRFPSRIATYGSVNSNSFPERRSLSGSHFRKGVLKGVGCSTGIVTAPIKKVKDPSRVVNLNGYVLVAEMTDPGWIYLMLAAKGIIVERGNILSHTAIIGREMGIPTVVGVSNALTVLNDGELVTIDGNRGTVKRLDVSEVQKSETAQLAKNQQTPA